MKKLYFGFVLVLSFALLIPLSVSAGQEKYGVCHIDDEGNYKLISIADPALDVHLAHGDKQPGTDGLDENCSPLRYIDNGDGTVTDTKTNLFWLQDAGCLGNGMWQDAYDAVKSLNSGECGLTDDSIEGDWRLPTKDEWEVTVADAVALGCQSQDGVSGGPALTDSTGTGCYSDETEKFFTNVSGIYWSGTRTGPVSPDFYAIGILSGNIFASPQTRYFSWWPVRDAQ